ncbi:hypothetical protein MPSI1_000006 [Malassezia psittaci]|uniref:triacylglycerol lipase n=1 Tax=Malassezia psittaci TaxID=1821823 RepID=A0AAF0F223_9BASI|nr:hypothetical protein MPSI1_000006 [Malassezia psittaci]
MPKIVWFSVVWAVVTCVILEKVYAASVLRRADILSPSNDPFYQPPKGWEEQPLGTILRTRRIVPALLTVKEVKVQDAYELLYRTSGTHETDAAVTVTTVLVPYNAQENKLVSVHSYVDSDGGDCAFSYTIQKGSEFPGDLFKDYQMLLMESILEAGYIVTVPDYQGSERAFAVGPLAGRQSLDGILATLRYAPLNLTEDTPVVSAGYSGGAIATGFAAELHPTYAPTINAKGFGMGGTPTNMTALLLALDGTIYSSFDLIGLFGIAYANPDVLDWLQPRLTTKGKQALEYVRSHCQVESILRYPFSRVLSDDFVKGGKDLLQVPCIEPALQEYVMGVNRSHTPTAPVWMYHAQHDDVVPYDDVYRTGVRWAKHGANVHFETFTSPLLAHTTAQLAGVPKVLFFLEDRFNDQPFAQGWHEDQVWNPLSGPRVVQQGLQDLVEILKDLMGDQVGPKDRILKKSIQEKAASKPNKEGGSYRDRK